MGVGCHSTSCAHGDLHDRFYSRYENCNRWNTVPNIRFFRLAAMVIFFERNFERGKWVGALSQSPDEDVLPSRDHPVVVPSCEFHGLLHRFDYPRRANVPLPSADHMACAGGDTDCSDPCRFRGCYFIVFLGNTSAFPGRGTCDAFCVADMDVHRSGRLKL